MPNPADMQKALHHHYQHASRLDARIHLHAKCSTNPQGFHAWVFEHLRLPPRDGPIHISKDGGMFEAHRHVTSRGDR
jgi:hypothetical protein